MENIYDKALNCKFHWQIEKIKVDYWYLDCEISYVITAKYNDELYLLQWIGKNLENKNPICTYERMYYAFSWNYPKVWDDLYVVAEWLSNDIKETWKNVYDANPDLNLCIQYPYSFMWWYIQERYAIMDKCKVSWKIETLIKTPWWQNCYYDLKLKINHNNQISYSYNTTEQMFDTNWISTCLWQQYMFPTFDINWKSYFPNKWDDFYWLVSTKTNELLKVWINNYNQYVNVPDCTWETISSNSWELLSSTWTNISSNKIEINTWKSLEQNISVAKKEIILPQKIVKSSSNKSVQIIKNDIVNSETVSWTIAKNTESNSWISNSTWVSNKPFKTETWVVVKQLNNDLVYTSSNSWIYVILIILVSVISLIFIKKKF